MSVPGLALVLVLVLVANAEAQSPSPAATRRPDDPMRGVDDAHGDREFLLLWPGGAPGALGQERYDRPKITIYRAPAATANGAAVIVCPGGGYSALASDHEGRQVAEWLNTLGVSAFVLQYRIGPRYHHPVPLQDAQRAIRLVRSRAQEWGLDPARVGILGFSAGGHLAGSAATHDGDGRPDAPDPIDRLGARPDFAILAYPVVSMSAPWTHPGSRRNLLGESPDPRLLDELSNEKAVSPRTPPAFLWHTAEDTAVPVENSLAFAQAMHQARVPVELHVFPRGRHGGGLWGQDPVLSQWPRLCATWLQAMGFLERPAAAR
jgi:acetyl esterase/lipase